MNKTCLKCGESKDEVDFHLQNKERGCRRNTCKEYDRKDIINGEKSTMFGLHGLLTFMLEHGIIEEGNYLIDPSW